MFEIVEAIAMFCVHLMMIAISIMVLYQFWGFLAALYRQQKPRKPKIKTKFSIPKNQSLRRGKTFKSSKSIRRG
jgi:hypothetical protein